jgi:hypothetical protein
MTREEAKHSKMRKGQSPDKPINNRRSYLSYAPNILNPTKNMGKCL